jgi:hypothetical protein
LCVSELRGLQELQARHPDWIVIAETAANRTDIDELQTIHDLLAKQRLTELRVVADIDWKPIFRLDEQLPQTVLLIAGRVRVVHDAVLPDPVMYLEADVAAIVGRK